MKILVQYGVFQRILCIYAFPIGKRAHTHKHNKHTVEYTLWADHTSLCAYFQFASATAANWITRKPPTISDALFSPPARWFPNWIINKNADEIQQKKMREKKYRTRRSCAISVALLEFSCALFAKASYFRARIDLRSKRSAIYSDKVPGGFFCRVIFLWWKIVEVSRISTVTSWVAACAVGRFIGWLTSAQWIFRIRNIKAIFFYII